MNYPYNVFKMKVTFLFQDYSYIPLLPLQVVYLTFFLPKACFHFPYSYVSTSLITSSTGQWT